MIGRYRIPLLFVLVVFIVVAVQVGIRIHEATDGVYRTAKQLQRVPEEHLFYPGSVDLAHGGENLSSDILGQKDVAFSSHTLGTNVSDEELFAFYRERLVAAGWQRSGADGSLSSGQLRAIVYRRGSLVIQVTTLQRGDVSNPVGINDYQTPYELYTVADRPR